MKLTRSHLIQLLSAAAGILISLYLLVQHTKLKTGIQEAPSFCSWGGGFDCDAVNISRYSEIAGIPLAAIGAVFYFAVLLLSLLRLFPLITWLSVAALAVDLVLFYVQAAHLGNYCILCLATYLCTLGIFASNLHIATGKISLSAANLAAAGKFRSAKRSGEVLLFAAIAAVCFLGFVMVLPQAIQSKSQSFNLVRNALEQFFKQWNEQRSQKLTLRPDDASFGDPQGVQVVEFSDFECPHCKRAAFVMDVLLKGFRNKVHFTFKNFPLDSSCNKAVPFQMHPYACQLAFLGKCAHKQGRFWKFHDLVFHRWSEENKSTDSLRAILREVFSKAEYAACLADEAVKKEVQDDIQIGSNLGIKGTPSIYINGKLVSIPLTVENLTRLIELESGARR